MARGVVLLGTLLPDKIDTPKLLFIESASRLK